MARISAWFGGLTTGAKAAVVVGALLLFVILSPLFSIVAVLFLIVCVPVVAYRMLMRRPFRRPGLFLLGSLAVLLLASGASSALYGTSTEQASSSSDTQAEPKEEQPREETTRVEAAAAPTENAEEDRDESPEKAAAKPEPDPKPQPRRDPKPEPEPDPEPKPDPEPEPKPDPEPRPVTEKDRNRSVYDATVTVSRVVDGDTVEISSSIDGMEDVRLIGVDTPETVDPGEEVEPYGPEASSLATRELTGREVELEFDEERIDSYDRLLAYVYTTDGRMFNEELVAKGYA